MKRFGNKDFYGLYALVGIWLCLGFYILVLTESGLQYFDVNEVFYTQAAMLVAEGKVLYRDFSFVQMPLQPWFYGFIFRVFGTSHHFLLMAKCVTIAISVANVITAFIIGRHFSQSIGIGVCCALLYMANEHTFRIGWEAANYNLSIFFFLLSILFCGSSGRTTTATTNAVLGGLSLGAAICTKLYFLPLVPFYWVLMALFPIAQPLDQKLKTVWLPFNYGLLGGVSPAILLVCCYPAAFWYNNVEFHTLYNTYRQAAYLGDFEWLHKGLGLAGNFTAKVGAMLSLLVVIVGMLALYQNFKSWMALWRKSPAEMGPFLLLVPGVVMMLLSMQIIFAQYYAVLAVLFVLMPAAIYRTARPALKKMFLILLPTVGILSFINFGYAHRDGLTNANWLDTYPNYPYPAHTLNQLLPSGSKVASLVPLIATDGGKITSYPQFSASVFGYIVSDRLSTENQNKYHLLSTQTVTAFLTKEKPALIITGWQWPEAWLDKPFVAYAKAHNYQLTELQAWDGDTLQCYIRPDIELPVTQSKSQVTHN